MTLNCRYLVLLLAPTLLFAQQQSDSQQISDLQKILERLDRLELENRNLAQEVRMLRQELAASRTGQANAPEQPQDAVAAPPEAQPSVPQAPPAAPLAERVDVAERRIEEQAQTKVEASQRLPITLTGMVLFNAFLNGRASGGQEDPTTASPANSSAAGGASLNQSILGLKFQGPQVWGGGQVNGSIYMDFSGGSTSSLNHLVRLRVATLEIDWKNQSFSVGQDKPIIAPREPNSLAQVAVSPLTGAGNLWLWSPEARFEQRFSFGEQAGLRAQLGVYQTSEPSYMARGGEYSEPGSAARPALEGRFEFWRQFTGDRRIEIAPGFHTSTTHVNGDSVASHLFAVDWLIQPVSKIQFTGTFFQGQNAAGVGGLRQGFSVFPNGEIVGIGVAGGWAQVSYQAASRLSFNVYGGQESDNTRNLLGGDILRNLTYAGNAIYRLRTNVLVALEAAQTRTVYVLQQNRLNNHYDLALAYLF